jgi:hypothetical protein
MTYTLYNTTTDAHGPLRSTPYTVDGEPGVLPEDMVELVVTRLDPPALTTGQRIEQSITADFDAGTLTFGWTVIEPTTEELAAIAAYVPPTVGPAQLRIAMRRQLSITAAQVDAAIAAIADDADRADATDLWEYATEIRRDHPLLAQLATALSLTSTDIDSAFRLAATF